MEATADTLLNQVANLFLSKIDKQNIDPKFLKKFTEQLLGKFSYTSSEPIKQKPAPSQGSTNGSLVNDLKQVYKELIKTDLTYKTDYKKFLKDVLPDELLKQSTDNVVPLVEKPEIKTAMSDEIQSDMSDAMSEITAMSDEMQSDMSDAMSEIKSAMSEIKSAMSEIKTVEKPKIKPTEKPEIKTVEKPEIKTAEKPEIKTVMSDFKSAMAEIKSTIFKKYSDIADEKLSPAIKILLNRPVSALPEIKPTEKSEIKTAPQMNEGRADLIKDAPSEQKVIFDGFTERGWAFFSERLPKILKGIMPPAKPDAPKEGSGLGLLGGGIALLLGGLAALVTGLMTDGPFKGLLKILSKIGIQGGLKLLEKGAKNFINTLKNFIDAPIKLLEIVGNGLKGALSSLLPKGIGSILKGAANIFTRMLGGLVKFLKPVLAKIPLIGTVISLGFAYTRFKSGDIVGGVIDVLSGIASIFPGVGTAIAIGLDVLNAFLDFKAGGANEKASQKKTGILKEWTLGLGKILYKGIKYIPIIGPYMQAVEDIQAGRWLEASYNLIRAIPGLGILVDVLNWFTGGETEQGIKENLSNAGSMIGDWLEWLKDSIWEKITGFVTGIFDTVKDWWNNLSWDPSTWLLADNRFSGEEEPTNLIKKMVPDSAKIANQTEQIETLTPMAEGGIVTESTKALVGEAGPEAVLPLDKYFDPQNLSLNNTTLEQIAGNTKDTNSSLQVLSDALFKLVTVLDKKMNQTGTTVINAPGQSSQQNSPASVIANINADPIRRVRMQFA